MHLKDLLIKEINVDFEKHIHIKKNNIKKYVHKWPEKFYEIVIHIQKTKCPTYSFLLPNKEGVLEFIFNKKTMKIDVFHKTNEKQDIHEKFRGLLKTIYDDLELEKLSLKSRNKINKHDKLGTITKKEIDTLLT
tara:strand:+ start:415 stop:816 length:402 start_codon:yes stop_codon:yes gene_type:complete